MRAGEIISANAARTNVLSLSLSRRGAASLLSKFVFIYCVPRRSSNLFSAAAILCVLVVENLQIIQRSPGKPDKVQFIRFKIH
jgi:hypothetical protein